MTLTLQHNRYDTVVPTVITESGCSISVPFYLNPTNDKKKEILNAFRTIKSEQLIKMNYSSDRSSGSLVVTDNTNPPQTEIEIKLGMNEANLRNLLFSRGGLQERIVIQLQELTGVQIFTKSEVQTAFKLWLDHLFAKKSR